MTYEPHPLAALIPPMLNDEQVELERDIQANGQGQPIILFEGKILDGRHRYAVCQKLKLTPETTTFTGTEAEAKALVLSLNVHRRHLSFEQKSKLIDAELKRDPSQSDRAIAEKAKVSHPTVAKIRREAEASGTVETVTTVTGKDGVPQPKVKAAKPKAETAPLPAPSTPAPAPATAPEMQVTSRTRSRIEGQKALLFELLRTIHKPDREWAARELIKHIGETWLPKGEAKP